MKIFFVFIFSISIFANFSGKWSAEGFYESNRNDGKCREVFLQLKQTKNSFKILDGGYICGEIQASYPPSSFDIINNELFYRNEKVGMVTDEDIRISYLDGVYNLSLSKVDGEILFTESWKEAEDFLNINAKLKALEF